MKENHQVTDTDGNHAEIHAEVVRGRNIHYENSLAPGEGLVTSTGSVLAKQNLIVSDSNYIKCSQSAYNSAGNKASSGIEIVHGESTNYQGSASAATIGDVLARQTLAAGRFDYTKGIQTVADGQYFSGIEIDHGLLTNYEGIASYQFSVASRISGSDQTLTTGKSNYIKCSQHASDSAGNKANTDLEIDHGYLTNYHGGAGSFAGHYGSYSIDASQVFDDVNGKQIEIKDLASDSVKTGEAHLNIKDGKISEYSGGITAYFHGMHNRNYGPLMDSSFIEASGKDIEIRTSSSDPLIGKSSARIEVKDGILRNSLVGSGWTRRTVHAIVGLSSESITGKKIELEASASNPENDKASLSIYVIDGVASNIGIQAESWSQSANAWASQYTPIDIENPKLSSLLGKQIRLDASAADKNGNTATVSTVVRDGTIENALSTPINSANVDTSANTISASQAASGVTGKKLELDATSKNAAKRR